MNYKALQKGYFRRNNNSKIKKKKKKKQKNEVVFNLAKSLIRSTLSSIFSTSLHHH